MTKNTFLTIFSITALTVATAGIGYTAEKQEVFVGKDNQAREIDKRQDKRPGLKLEHHHPSPTPAEPKTRPLRDTRDTQDNAGRLKDNMPPPQVREKHESTPLKNTTPPAGTTDSGY